VCKSWYGFGYNCTGTGGFLVSSMNLMVKDAKGDQEKIKNIKLNQLFGVEYDADIFTLACSNMFIHQDGKSNILKGSCFDKNITEEVKKIKPNAGLLNPPYKSDKKNDIDEFEFIINNLDCLERGGKCVAIVPMSCGLATSGEKLVLKEKLLQNHTLEAVFSMPDELFFNSKVGVPTCIMVITAKKPHTIGKKTYFGYYKEDGFIKRKNLGKVDLYKNFEDRISKDWILNYQNRENIDGLSVNKAVKASDEWCAENYMSTNFNQLEKAHFEKTIREYLSYLIEFSEEIEFSEDNIKTSSAKKIDQEIKLDFSNWKAFMYDDIFHINRGKSNPEDFEHKTLIIGASQNKNGSNGEWIEAKSFYEYPVISVGNGGNTDCGQTFFQSIPFNAKSTVNVLTLRERTLNSNLAMFLTTVIKLEKYRFAFGRGWSLERMKESIIKLPAKANGQPDWQFMENYIKSLSYSSSI